MIGTYSIRRHLLLLSALAFTLTFWASSIRAAEINRHVLMFVSHDRTYYTEYVVMRQALESAGYTVDVRSAVTAPASLYGGGVIGHANSAPGLPGEAPNNNYGYNLFLAQFENNFGSPWPESLNAQPGTIPVNGRIQDVSSMDNYDALVVVGGDGAVAYRVDGSYSGHGEASAADVQSASEHLNSLAIDALLEGKPVLAQCHGSSLAPFWRIPGTENVNNPLGISLLQDQQATGFPLGNETAAYMQAFNISYRAADRVVISNPHPTLEDDGSADARVMTTRDWYPQTIAHAARTLINVIETYPSTTAVDMTPVSTLIIHGGAVDPDNCSASNRQNDIPCNYPDWLPADYTHLAALLNADSSHDNYVFSVADIDITEPAQLPFDINNADSVFNYLQGFDAVIYFKHWQNHSTLALQNGLIDYTDNGGTTLAIHHAMYNDGPGKSTLVDELFKVHSRSQTFGRVAGTFDLYLTNFGHFVTTYGVVNSLPPILMTPPAWENNPLLNGANTSLHSYQNFPVFDEIYTNFEFVEDTDFGRGIDQVTPLLSNAEGFGEQMHTGAFVRLFNPSADATIGKFMAFAYGERRETLEIDEPYGQMIRNAVAWSRLALDYTPLPEALSPPDDITASTITSQSFTLSWLPPQTDYLPLSYEVEINSDLLITTHTENVVVENLVPDQLYSVRVRAINNVGEVSDFSPPLTVHTLVIDDNEPPTAPDNLQVLHVSNNSVVLAWDASFDNVSNSLTYTLYQNGSAVESGIQATTLEIGGLQADTLYNFAVQAVDAAGNSSTPSNAVSVTTLMESDDPLAILDDEFGDINSLNSWTRLYQQENWLADPLHSLTIDNDQLILEPSARTWWQGRIGPLLYKEVSGDFIVTALVQVSDVNGGGIPTQSYSLGGLMLRAPQFSGYDAQEDPAQGQNYFNALLGYTTNGPRILNNSTQNNQSTNPSIPVPSWQMEIRIARLGDALFSLYRQENGDWQISGRIERSDLPQTLQVGMATVADYGSASSISTATHNNTVVNGNENIRVSYDFLRFRTPQVPEEYQAVDPLTLSDGALIDFLGVDTQPENAEPIDPPPFDPLSLLNDEFANSSSLDDWLSLYETENWNADPLNSIGIEAGQLVMEPSARTWYMERIGGFRYKEVAANFSLTTHLRVSDLSGLEAPGGGFYSLAGLIIRAPQVEGYDAQTDFTLGQQNYFSALLGNTTHGPDLLGCITTQSVSTFETYGANSYDMELRVARIGTHLVMLGREPGAAWTVYGRWSADWLPSTVQAGMAVVGDHSTAIQYAPAQHNDMLISGNVDLRAEYDYVHFATVVLPDGVAEEDIPSLGDVELIAILGD